MRNAMTSKLMTLDQAAALVEDGMQIGIGGWIFNSQPMALVRAIINAGRRNLRLVPAPGSVAPDMFIGARAAASTACVFISFEHFGLAPNFRRASEEQTIKVYEMDGPSIAGGLRAGACDIPYMPIPDMGTDLPRVNPEHYLELPSGPDGRRLLAAPSVQPDVVLLHGQQADHFGNIQYFGGAFFDPLMVQAGKKVIVSVDRIVSPEEVRANNRLTKIPAAFVDAVVEAPFGAHPTSSAGFYDLDDKHMREYVELAQKQETFDTYVKKYVHEVSDHTDYLAKVGVDMSRIAKWKTIG